MAERVRCSFEQRRRCAVVIDRDPEVVRGLSALLSAQLDVQSALCPSSAALLLDRLEHVDLAFVELELPDFAGEQLLQQLGRWPDAIRVLLTQQPLSPTSSPATRSPASSSPASSSPASSSPDRRGRSTPAFVLPRNAYLAHLVLSKPVSVQVVRALQRATLGLLRV
ncbi:MAG TPA: hypothetical protein VFS67_27315 [Polyangiaceae bacterium]|nr:hypothetical protein [Polyangiaceae bacterium]